MKPVTVFAFQTIVDLDAPNAIMDFMISQTANVSIQIVIFAFISLNLTIDLFKAQSPFCIKLTVYEFSHSLLFNYLICIILKFLYHFFLSFRLKVLSFINSEFEKPKESSASKYAILSRKS